MSNQPTVEIIIDEREAALYSLLPEQNTNLTITKKVLELGDVIIQLNGNPVLVIERKTFQDLFASIKDGRYQEQSYRLIHGQSLPPHNIAYLIEGIVSQLTQKEQSLLYSTITSLNLYKGFSIYRTTHMRDTADFILAMANKILRNARDKKEFPLGWGVSSCLEPTLDQDLSAASPPPATPAPYSSVVKIEKKANITPENIGSILLCQIPSINSITAEQIMKKYGTIRNLIETLVNDQNALQDFYMTTASGGRRKLSRAIIENIRSFLLPTQNQST
jgi:ERCC4-type nuclease